jgi:hypothetical protein
VRAHLILCFRAEEKIEIIKEDGKTKIVPKQGPTGLLGWMPVCEKALPFELTASFLMTHDAPGVPKPIKLQEQHRALFPLDQPITEDAGRAIAEWSTGTSKVSPEEVLTRLREVALEGVDALRTEWSKQPQAMRTALHLHLDSLKKAAALADSKPRIPQGAPEQHGEQASF